MQDIQKLSALAVWTAAALGLAGAAFADNGGFGFGGAMGGHGGDDIAARFASLDTDSDGTVTMAEQEAHHAARFAQADTDKDGKLSADELAAMQIKAMEAMIADRSARMIEALDSDGDALVSGDEFAQMQGTDRMMGRMDADGDGAITLEEAEDGMDGRGGKGHGKGGHGGGRHGGGFWGMFGGDGN